MSPCPWVRRATRHLAPGVLCATLGAGIAAAQAVVRVTSPDGRNQVTFQIKDGRAYYDLQRDGRALVLRSLLGFEFKRASPLRDRLGITDTTPDTHDEPVNQPSGEVAR